jgi:hypothetical protein
VSAATFRVFFAGSFAGFFRRPRYADPRGRGNVGGMTDSAPQTHSHYRLLDKHDEPLDEADWPNDAEAVAWAERHRTAHQGPAFRRIERRDGDRWTFVSEAGLSDQDRSSEEL